MRRIQQGLGMLVAIFALAGVLTLSGCKKEESTGDKIDKAADQTKDAVDDAAKKAKEVADDMSGE